MVAKITTPLSTEKTLRYNERKVESGKAFCLGGENCLHDPQQMTMKKKLMFLEHRNALNDRAATKTIHISLNFSNVENLTANKLKSIAAFYMEKIGFGEQPYFIYQHYDAGHPHIHIVGSTIRTDGSRIGTHNIGRNQSERARKETEHHFDLKVNNLKNINGKQLPAVTIAKKALYGKKETKQSIAYVINMVIRQYNYTSFSELNALLMLYNVVADRGKSNSELYKKGGLYYRILNNKGNKIGVPVKASGLPGKPTLSRLEELYQINKLKKEQAKHSFEKSLTEVLLRWPKTIGEVRKFLNEKNISVFLHSDGENNTDQITFIDRGNRCVFSGSDLDKYHALTSLQTQWKTETENKSQSSEAEPGNILSKNKNQYPGIDKPKNTSGKPTSVVQELIETNFLPENVFMPLLSKKKKRNNKNHS